MNRSLLRFITCGSVDDGKSTLLGRLLFDCRQVFDDQLKALEADSRTYGTQGRELDFALLVDGLEAEREQAITIDVAYRFFSTDRRAFIVADTPGHEQYTRNMATGASTADLAVLLVDARKGLLTQTRRHTRIVAMLGVRQVVLAVNKMDLVEFSKDAFDAISTDYATFAGACGISSITPIPTCAIAGDNIVHRSTRTAWFTGPTLLQALEAAPSSHDGSTHPFRMPIQYVNRPSADFRGYAGRIVSGAVGAGQDVRILPSGTKATVKEVVRTCGDGSAAERGESVTITFHEDLDAGRGDVLSDAASPCPVADQFEATLLWMSERSLVAGRPYVLKLHAKEVNATITGIKYREDVNTGAHLAARALSLNEIGIVNVSTSQPIAFEPYATNRVLGGFILIDKETCATVGAGMIGFALRRSSNIHWQHLDIDRHARALAKHQHPVCLWFTGLSGSGKSTIANLLEKRLHAEGRHTYVLDGDNVRHGLNRDLGFTEADRVENIRRVAEVARLMVDAGLIVLVSFISPFRAERRMARDLFAAGEFIEVFVDTPLEECARRDPKGLYRRAYEGALKNFTGIDSPYERPEAPEVHVTTAGVAPEECVTQVYERFASTQP